MGLAETSLHPEDQEFLVKTHEAQDGCVQCVLQGGSPAVLKQNREHHKEIQSLQRDLFHARLCLCAFQASEGRVKGDKGVADHLHMTTARVYQKLEKIGITADAVRQTAQSGSSAISLLRRSSVFQEKLQKSGMA